MRIRGLSYSLPDGTVVLDSIDLEVPAGQAVFIFGLNGAGKSTLALALSGILNRLRDGKIEGEITVDGRDVFRMSPFERVSSVGLLLQNPELQVFSTTLRDEIGFVLENLSWSRAEIEERTDELLESVGLTEMAEASPEHLSQGQKQLLSFCVAIAARPSLIVLDEPDTFLDPVTKERLWQLVEKEKERGASVFIMSSWPSPPHVADLSFTLENGRLKDGFPTGFEPPEIEASGSQAYPVITLKNVRMERGERPVFDIPELEIPDGLTILTGDTGSGKTTFTRLTVGLEHPAAGSITLMGRDIRSMKLSEIGRIVGYLFQSPEKQIIERSVSDEIAFSLTVRDRYSDKKLKEILELFDLVRIRDRFPLSLSGGEIKRVALASLFALNPDYIVMDEPEANLDPVQLKRLSRALHYSIIRSKGALITSPNRSHIRFKGRHMEVQLNDYRGK